METVNYSRKTVAVLVIFGLLKACQSWPHGAQISYMSTVEKKIINFTKNTDENLNDWNEIFPEFSYDDHEKKNHTVPKCPEGETYCKIVNPEIDDDVDRALKSNELYKGILTHVNPKPISIGTRFDSELNPSCHSHTEVIYPNVAENRFNTWIRIVNTDKFQQGIVVEKCSYPEKECLQDVSQILNVKYECRQFHLYKRVIVLNDKNEPSEDEILFPSCCKCVKIS